MTPEQRAAWEVDAARVREIAALIADYDVTTPDSCHDVVALANEAQVDILQVKWHPIETGVTSDPFVPHDEWPSLYRLVNEASVRWNRRRQYWVAHRDADAVADGIRAALARVPELAARAIGAA